MEKSIQELFVEQSRTILASKQVIWEEKRMMGGVTFMVEEKMCFGGFKGGLLCRVDPEERPGLLERPGANTMKQGGREMKGYVHVQPDGFATYEDLEFWITKCLEFNPKAKSKKQRNR